MLDDFFTRALLAGCGIALVTGPLGCFVVWRRLAYFGDTLSHAALLGVALAILFDIHLILAVFLLSAAVALSLLGLQKRADLSSDALLGLLSHGSLALGLLAVALLSHVRFDLMGLLFGDILAVSEADLAIIYIGGAAVLVILVTIWRPLFASTVNHELSAAEGMAPGRANLIFMLLMALVIAMAMKVVGVLLITALLIMPAAAARRMASGPESMAVLASVIGAGCAVFGLLGSLEFDTPSGPSIVATALLVFVLSLLPFEKLAGKSARPEASQ